ncbi:hypothetical protein PPERSA_12289 [Pseudocohnilembus persalinus]|uniref:EF-hand domain-containing protein n=1 Tax=Pseudocohnilembus persalinus TaxID=266149 RepID=A0A0V0R580_PSEPJ|nr:hypothetical protein PPERSA_12289 [Pseudocohnilembus persalinus]|eukprot:KRX09546.1 hypothetical protein PPERSA_12289 [Pseudocohnilembus persalinus]
MINTSNSSINDILSSVDDDPMMKEMKAKLAQINNKYPDIGESVDEDIEEDYKEQNEEEEEEFEMMDAVDADENFYLTQEKQKKTNNQVQNSKSQSQSRQLSNRLSGSPQYYDTDSENQQISSGKSKQNQQYSQKIQEEIKEAEEQNRDDIIMQKMQKKLKEQKAKVAQSKGGTKPFYKAEKTDADTMVKDILKRHNIKLQEIQKKNEDLYVKEAIEKMKAKQVKQNLTYYDAEKDKQWVDVRTKTETGPKFQNKKIDNEKNAGKIASQIEYKLKGQRPPVAKSKVESKPVSDQQSVSTKQQFSVNIGAGVKTEREKGEMAQRKKIQSMATSAISKGPGLGDMQRLQKLKEKERQLKQKERERLLAEQAKKFVKEGQDFTEGKNNVIKNIKQSKEKNVQDPKEAKKEQIALAEKKRIDERNELEQEEIKRLRVQLRQLKEDGQVLQKTYKEVEQQKNQVLKKVKVYEKHPSVICLGDGQYTSFSLVPEKKDQQSMASTSIGDNSDILDDDQDVQEEDDKDKRSFDQDEQEAIMAMTVVEKLVTKLDESGKDLNDLFKMIDSDGDEILTIKEIQQGLPELEIDDFYQEDIDELIKILDENSDGLIDEQEFVQALESKLQQQKAYRKIMGNNKADPQELQLRTLDMQIRAKYVIRNFKKEKAVASVKDNKYKKLIQQLKKEEENYKKRQSLKKKVDVKQLEKELVMYQNKQRQVLDDKDKLKIMQQERISEIMDNIQDLLEKLNMYTEKVVAGKLELQQKKEMYQQIALKEIAYDQIKDRIHSLKKEREQDLLAQKAKREMQLKQKAGMQAESKKKLITLNETVNAALLVQKIVRGWKERIKAKKRKDLFVGAARLIGKAFILKKRDQGIKAGKDALVSAFKGMQELGMAGIRQRYLSIKNDIVYQKIDNDKVFQNYIKMGRDVIYKKIDVEKEIEDAMNAQMEMDIQQQELFQEMEQHKGEQAVYQQQIAEVDDKSSQLKPQIQDKWGQIIQRLQGHQFNKDIKQEDQHRTEAAQEKERFQRINEFLQDKIYDIKNQFIYRDNQYLKLGYLDVKIILTII